MESPKASQTASRMLHTRGTNRISPGHETIRAAVSRLLPREIGQTIDFAVTLYSRRGIEGGSFGLQIGAGETDLTMLAMNEDAAKQLRKSAVKIGGASW